jgi:FkbM family methyltransferase
MIRHKLFRVLGAIPGFYIFFVESFLLKSNHGTSKVSRNWHGVNLELDLLDPTQRKVAFGNFEVIERRFIHRVLRDSEIAIDIGANIGLISLAMVDSLKEGARIYSYEPVKTNFDQLYLNMQKHARVFLGKVNSVCQNLAVSSGFGLGTLDLGLPGLHRGQEVSNVSGFYSNSTSENMISVKSIGINTLLNPLDRIDFMKIDTEGMEEEILCSITETNLRKISLIMFEFTISNMGHTFPQRETIEKLQQSGFRVLQPIMGTSKRPLLMHLSIRQSEFAYRMILSIYSRITGKEPLTTINFVASRC